MGDSFVWPENLPAPVYFVVALLYLLYRGLKFAGIDLISVFRDKNQKHAIAEKKLAELNNNLTAVMAALSILLNELEDDEKYKSIVESVREIIRGYERKNSGE